MQEISVEPRSVPLVEGGEGGLVALGGLDEELAVGLDSGRGLPPGRLLLFSLRSLSGSRPGILWWHPYRMLRGEEVLIYIFHN